jgi:hypothetical protein
MKPQLALRTIFEFFRSCATSRLAWLFACLHAAWFFLAIANMSPPSPAFADFLDRGGSSTSALLAGRPFHYHYESVLLQILVWADLPSMFVGILLALSSLPLLVNIQVGHYAGSYFGAGLLLLIATFQWFVVGKSVKTWLSSKSWELCFFGHSLVTSRSPSPSSYCAVSCLFRWLTSEARGWVSATHQYHAKRNNQRHHFQMLQ